MLEILVNRSPEYLVTNSQCQLDHSHGTKLVVRAAYEKMKADNVTKMREKFVYEHELPKDVEDASMTKNFVTEGLLEIAIKRKLNL
uniref:Uncharacterized protein n=1 Tax=Romanomermis culicivorax TaxID=13658 RepID=A0A915HWH6_ROMCU